MHRLHRFYFVVEEAENPSGQSVTLKGIQTFNRGMDPFDPAIQGTAVYGWKSLLTLGLFAGVGSFFFGRAANSRVSNVKDEEL